MAYFPKPAFWSEDPSLLTSSEDEESDSRYRITHQHAKTKRQGKTKRSKGQEKNKDFWTWEQIMNGEGPWAKAGENRRSQEEREAAKAQERWFEEAARRRGWKPEKPWEQVEALRRAEATWERNRSYEGTRLARKPKKPPGVTSAGTSHQV
ncbi:uncharacterized protein ACWYII_020415 [Salvelinus alpinus]